MVAGLPCGTIGTPNKFVALNNPTLWTANLDYNGVNVSTSEGWFPHIPLNTVKFEPYWTQVDVNLQKLFNVGNWQYDARIEFFNALNTGVEVWHSGSRNGRSSTGAGYQSLSNWERAEKLLEGRVIRFAVTARFPPASLPLTSADAPV